MKIPASSPDEDDDADITETAIQENDERAEQDAAGGRHPKLRSVFCNSTAATVLLSILAAAALLAGAYVTSLVIPLTSPHQQVQQYVDMLNMGEFTQILDESDTDSANGTDRDYLTRIVPNKDERAHDWRIVDLQSPNSTSTDYSATLSYELNGHKLTTFLMVSRHGSDYGFIPKWSFLSPPLSMVTLRLPQGDTAVSVNGVQVDLLKSSDSISSVDPSGQCDASSCTDYTIALFPGMYDVGLPLSGSTGQPATVAVTAGGWGTNIDAADLSQGKPTLLQLESPLKMEDQSLSTIVKSHVSSTADYAAVAFKLEGRDGGESDGWHSYSASSDSTTIGTMPAAIPYFPVYLMAHAQQDTSIQQLADAMLANKDDTAGDRAIARLGGVGKVDSWLAGMGFPRSSFGQTLGEFSSGAQPAIWTDYADGLLMVSTAYQDGAESLMHDDLSALGVRIPDGLAVHAIYGELPASRLSGVVHAVYGVASYQGHTVSLAITTRGIGQADAAEMTSDILANIKDQLSKL